MPKIYIFTICRFLLFAGLVGITINCWQILQFVTLKDNFVIVAKSQTCERPLNNRCVTFYKLRLIDGRVVESQVPFGFRPQDLMVGNAIKKSDFFSYEINGIRILWNPTENGIWLSVSCLCIFVSYGVWARKKNDLQPGTDMHSTDHKAIAIFRIMPHWPLWVFLAAGTMIAMLQTLKW